MAIAQDARATATQAAELSNRCQIGGLIAGGAAIAPQVIDCADA
jgi:hypothetical protein